MLLVLPLLVVSLAMPAGASRVAAGPNALPLGVRLSNFEMHRLAVDWPILNNQQRLTWCMCLQSFQRLHLLRLLREQRLYGAPVYGLEAWV